MDRVCLICEMPPCTIVARWEEHLAWLRDNPGVWLWEQLVEVAEKQIAHLKELGDPFPDHTCAGPARSHVGQDSASGAGAVPADPSSEDARQDVPLIWPGYTLDLLKRPPTTKS